MRKRKAPGIPGLFAVEAAGIEQPSPDGQVGEVTASFASQASESPSVTAGNDSFAGNPVMRDTESRLIERLKAASRALRESGHIDEAEAVDEVLRRLGRAST